MKGSASGAGRFGGLQIQRVAGTVAKECFEGRAAQGRVNAGVVSKFNGDEVVMPMLVEMIKIMAEAFDNRLVGTLREALSLRVKRCAEVELGASEAEEFLPKFALELGAAVGAKCSW